MRIGFVMEQGLGHITHTQNLQRQAVRHRDVDPLWVLVPYQAGDILEKMAPMSIKMGFRARKMLRAVEGSVTLDCLFFHTQVLSLLNYDYVGRIPSVISLDATPRQFDRVSQSYGAQTAAGGAGRIKHQCYRRTFMRAVGLVAVSDWVRDSLVDDYGIEREKIVTIPYSVDVEQWTMPDRAARSGKRVRLLFVGGDFERKGGDLLLEAYRGGLAEHCELDIVTRDESVVPEKFVRVHRNLKPGTPELRRLFAEADIFVLPTMGDAHSIVSLEAMAVGLPVISTRVGAIPEIIEHGVSGYLLDDTAPATIESYVRRLVNDPDMRREMGLAGRKRVEQRFNARLNYDRLIAYLKQAASHHGGGELRRNGLAGTPNGR